MKAPARGISMQPAAGETCDEPPERKLTVTSGISQQPAFLTKRDEPVFRIRCPVHGFIRFSENELEVIDHPLFRRLRFIRQLALTEYIYPGATHTRFEHSLGVMEVATRAFDRLASFHGALLERTFCTVGGFEDKPLAKARQVLRLSALLHDVGHACFCHAAEEIIFKGSTHEHLTVCIITDKENKDFLGSVSEKHFFTGCADFVGKVIKGDLPPQLQILGDLVSGEIDADRTDYLLRDSLHCGVEYGRFDYRRMIECLELQEGEAGRLELALHQNGIHTFEALILARYQMNTQIYHHRLRRIYDLYLREYIKAKGPGFLDTADKILQHNDVTMMAVIFDDASGTGGPWRQWAVRIRDRTHHREVFRTSEAADAIDLRRAREVFDHIRSEHADLDFRWDLADVAIHRLLVTGDREETKLIRFPLVGAGAPGSLVGEKSHILRHVPKSFQVGRIFCDLGRHQKDERKKISDYAYDLYRRKGGKS
jgi:HD superfamily phosphohydrolase